MTDQISTARCRCGAHRAIDCGSLFICKARRSQRPEPNRTAAECLALLGEVYTPEGLAILLEPTHPALGDPTVAEHLETPDGRRRVYGLALSLAEGTFS
jgi:hypothetical protein